MKKVFLLACTIIITLTTYAQKIYQYPYAFRDTVVDNYFGVQVADPYQWMEDPENEKLQLWLEQQKEFTKKQRKNYSKESEIIYQIKKISYTQHLSNELEGDEEIEENKKYDFYIKSSNIKDTPSLYYRRENGQYNVLFRSKAYRRSRNDKVVIEDYTTDPRERVVAVTISHSGSDWNETYIFDLVSGNQLNEVIRYTIVPNIVWGNDGFYYTRYDSIDDSSIKDLRKRQRLCYHRVGSDQKEDKVLYYNPDTTGFRTFSYTYAEKSKSLYLYHPLKVRTDWYNAVSTISTNDTKNFNLNTFLAIPEKENATFSIEIEKGDTLILKTNYNSPKHRLVYADKNQLNKLYDFIPEYEDNLIDVNELGDDKIACFYSLNGKSSVLIYGMDGNIIKAYEFPQGINVKGFQADSGDKYTYYSLHSFYQPTIYYRVDLKTFESEATGRVSINYQHDQFITSYVEYPSKDGTMIPMYLTHRKDIELDGSHPSLLYAYGGYGTTLTPQYNLENILWLLNGGILAIPNVRGGGSKGSEWANAGRGINKQNTIDDFIGASDFLIKNKYSNPQKIAIEGSSHGGMLVAAAMVLKPQNFKAVVTSAGVYDMLRHHLFTAGSHSLNYREYGVSNNKDEFYSLIKYSPLHNIKKFEKYPNILVITGNNDTRVAPLHAYKFIASLQQNADPSSLYMLNIIENTGHQEALTVKDYFDGVSLKFGFLFDQLEMR